MNTQELTSLITRLEEEYGKATPKDWVAGEYENGGYWYGRIFFPGDPRNHLTNTRDCPMSKGDVAFIADAHNSMPTLLGALRHYMAVVEAARACPHSKENVGKFGFLTCDGTKFGELENMTLCENIVAAEKALSSYRKSVDTPSN